MKNIICKSKVLSSIILLFACVGHPPATHAQSVLFTFDAIPAHTPFPVSETESGITAYLSGTGESYSIQDAGTLGFTPSGFSGNIIYPNSIYLADLLIKFDKTITDFSIMYACQELACDDAATMRVTAYLAGSWVGTNTKMTSHPGTWPVDTLQCSFASFDSVVVHYDHKPPTCADYGVIYLADNMRVTPYGLAVPNVNEAVGSVIVPNPVSNSATISFSLGKSQNVRIAIYDLTGRKLKNVFDGSLAMGEHHIDIGVGDKSICNGLYILNMTGEAFSRSYKLVVAK